MNNTMGPPTFSLSSSSFMMIGLQDTDIVCGRGGLANKHPGNRLLRRICNENRALYQSSTDPYYKQCLILSILRAIRQNGGRFLTRKGDAWKEISDKKAKEKTAQLLREAEDSSSAISSSTTSSYIKPTVKAAQETKQPAIQEHFFDDCFPTPALPQQQRIISPESSVKGLYHNFPYAVPSSSSDAAADNEDLSNLLQQPLLEVAPPPTLVEEESAAPPPAAAASLISSFDVNNNNNNHNSHHHNDDELFERLALEVIETEIACHGPTWSPRFVRNAGNAYYSASSGMTVPALPHCPY